MCNCVNALMRVVWALSNASTYNSAISMFIYGKTKVLNTNDVENSSMQSIKIFKVYL